MPRHRFEPTTIAQANCKKRLEEVGEDIKLAKAELEEMYGIRRGLIAEARDKGLPDASIARALDVCRSVVAVVPK